MYIVIYIAYVGYSVYIFYIHCFSIHFKVKILLSVIVCCNQGSWHGWAQSPSPVQWDLGIPL